jgi:hypothetical protein
MLSSITTCNKRAAIVATAVAAVLLGAVTHTPGCAEGVRGP